MAEYTLKYINHRAECDAEAFVNDCAIPEEECDFLGYELLQQAGRRRGFLLRGGEIDTERMARILLDEFRGGVLGRITLEKPE